jgi:DNA-binding response OmpR family regulator
MRTVTLVSRHEDVLALVPALERQGFSIAASSPTEFADRAGIDRPAALLLDLRDLPLAAFELIRTTYRDTSVLIVLVGREQLERVPPRLDVDDFVVMPADAAEVHRRLERALWRRFGVDEQDVVRCGALAIDLANYRVTVAGEPVVLTFKEYELLRFLAVNAGRVFTREQLLNRVWGYDYFGGARTVDVHIRRIRAKVEVKGYRFIETVRNVGYRLVPSAQREPVAE